MGITTASGSMTSEEIVALSREHTIFSWSVQGALDPIAIDRAEGVSDVAPVRPAEVDGGGSANERGDDCADPHPAVSRQRPRESPHAVTAGRPARSTTSR